MGGIIRTQMNGGRTTRERDLGRVNGRNNSYSNERGKEYARERFGQG